MIAIDKNVENWVDEIPTLSDDIRYCDAMYTYLEVVTHVLSEIGITKTYRKITIRINSAADFGAVNPIRIDVQNGYEEIRFHNLRVYRADSVFDKTTEMSFQELQREKELESNILTGTKTYISQIEDIRVGDIVSYELTSICSSPFSIKHFEFHLPTNYGLPVYTLRASVQYINQTHECWHREYDGREHLAAQKLEAGTVFSFHKKEVQGASREMYIPVDRSPYSYIEFSDCESWDEIGRMFSGYFETGDHTSELVIETVKNKTEQSKEKPSSIEAIVRFVQQEIAYLSIGHKGHGFVPHNPAKVLQSNYGDCKDRSLLLQTMLRVIDVSSNIVLVNVDSSKNIPKCLPSAGCFNHAIVSIDWNGGTYLVDPTNSFDCFSIENGSEPPFFSGLYLDSVSELKTRDKGRNSVYKNVSTMNVCISGDQANITASDTFSYWSCSSLLQRRSVESLQSIKDQLLNYYANYYPGIVYKSADSTGQEFAFVQDRERNQCSTTSHYFVEKVFKSEVVDGSERQTAAFAADDIYSTIPRLPAMSRAYPFRWNHPVLLEVNIDIEPDFLIHVESENRSVRCEVFEYTFHQSQKDGHVLLQISYRSIKDSIEPSEYENVKECIETVHSWSNFIVTRDNRAVKGLKGMFGAGRPTVGKAFLFVFILMMLIRLVSRLFALN